MKFGDIAQRESTWLAAKGSGVQIPLSPLKARNNFYLTKIRIGVVINVVEGSWLKYILAVSPFIL